jgi:hypothetical protein
LENFQYNNKTAKNKQTTTQQTNSITAVLVSKTRAIEQDKRKKTEQKSQKPLNFD